MPLTCPEIPKLASDYVGRDLPVAMRLRMGLHLAICKSCRAYVQGLGRARDLAAQSLRGPAPDAVLRALGLHDAPATPDHAMHQPEDKRIKW